ncbi:MAG: hypothetical protein E7455_09320, partial [Ruminococcaceae bacterium]|nr:hypothetical protein [Oscillospiraceae bacterium]
MKRNLNRGISLLLTVCLVLGIFASSGLTLVRAEDANVTTETNISYVNLIENGTFGEAKDVTNYADKTLPEGWSGVGLKTSTVVIQVTDAYALDGTKSVHIAGANEKACNLSLDYTFTADDLAVGTVVVSAWVRGVVNVKTVRMGAEFRRADSSTIGSELAQMEVGEIYGEWTELTVTATIPADAAWARIKPIELTSGADADIYVDCVSAKIGDKELFVNTSFETMPENAEATVTKDVLFTSFYGWTAGAVTNGSAAAVADPADSKNGVLKIEDISDTNYPTVYTGGFPVEVGATYKFTAKYKVDDVDAGMTATINLRGNGYSSPKAENNIVKLDVVTMNQGTTEWTATKEALVTIPEGVETFYAMFNTPKASVGNIYIDEVTLIKVCDEHDWSDAVVTGEGNCESALVSTKTCSKCGAAEITTSTYDHTWSKGACSVCGAACEHNAPEGYCTICGLELPAQIIDNELIINGSFESKTTYTSYFITNEWQLGGEGWYIGGNNPDEDMTMAVTNEWSSDGDWAFKITDTSNENATSININVPVNADGKDKELYMAADVYAALNDMSFTVTPYVGNYNEGGTKAADAIGPGILKNYSDGATASATGTIPGNADSLRVSITSRKAIGETDAERVAQVIIDNLVLTIDGGENLLAGMNGSFESLPVGSEPVVTTGAPTISYLKGSSTREGWYGLDGAIVEGNVIEEIVFTERDGKQTAALHLIDNYSKATAAEAGAAANATSVNYYLYDLEKETTYNFTFDAYRTASNAKVTVVQLDGNTIVGSSTILSDYVNKGEWTTFNWSFTTENVDFTRIRIQFATTSDAITEAWFDNFSLTKACDHAWENPDVVDATCASVASRTVTCACGAVGVTEYGAVSENHTLVGATCTIPSYCSVPGCGYIAAEALGHTWVDGVCSVCEKVCGHTYVDEEGNSTGSICAVCGKGCEHVYDYDCDAECNICGFIREASHQYFYPCDPVCMICYEITNPDAAHNVIAVEAVEATCVADGNIAYWICTDCNTAWADEALTMQTNRYNVITPATGEHTYENG